MTTEAAIRDGVRYGPIGRVPFPAGVSVLALVWGFVSTRVFVGLAVRHPGVAAAGIFAAVSGVLLALGACAVLAWQSARGPFAVLVRALRLLILAPVAVLAIYAMAGSMPQAVEQSGLVAGCIAVLVACGRGVVVARGQTVARVTLALLGIGETLELLGPPARVAFEGREALAIAQRVGPWVEGMAFVGVLLALVWAIRSTMAVTEGPRVSTYGAMPVGLAMIIATLPVRYPHTTETVARYGFGVRFDLVTHGTVSHPSPAAMAMYSLLGSGLLAALIISLAGQYLDQGGAPRRVLGWACILIGGFGAVTMAGAVDPFRTVAVVLGAMLLEQSVAMEGAKD